MLQLFSRYQQTALYASVEPRRSRECFYSSSPSCMISALWSSMCFVVVGRFNTCLQSPIIYSHCDPCRTLCKVSLLNKRFKGLSHIRKTIPCFIEGLLVLRVARGVRTQIQTFNKLYPASSLMMFSAHLLKSWIQLNTLKHRFKKRTHTPSLS